MNPEVKRAAEEYADKKCTKCGVFFPATLKYFYRDIGSSTGLHSHCKACRLKSRNLEKRKRSDAEKYLRTKDKFSARNKAHKRFGNPSKFSCSVLECGSPAEELHHVWYQSPLDVVPMCRKHHKQNHITCSEGDAHGFARAIRMLRDTGGEWNADGSEIADWLEEQGK